MSITDNGLRLLGLLILLSLNLGLTKCDVLPCASSSNEIVEFQMNDTIESGTVILDVNEDFVLNPTGTCTHMDLVNGTLVLNTDLRGALCGESSIECGLRCSGGVIDVTVVFTIHLIDLYPTTFPQPLFHANVSEGVPIGTGVFYFDKNESRATDDDCSTNINYKIEGSSSEYFFISGNDGNVTTKAQIDYDIHQEFNITVVASVSTHNETSATTTLLVRVMDVDNKPPSFSTIRYVLDIPEGTISLDTLTSEPPLYCSDLDVGINTTVLYNITDTDSYIEVDNDTGSLRQQRAFDREIMSEWQTTIICYQKDDISKFDTAILHVNVVDVNDNAAIFDPTSRKKSLIENAFSGTYLTAVTATDADLGDNAIIIYQIVQPSETFQIDNMTGVITVKDPELLDREQFDNITIVVYAVDKDGNYSANNLTITVSLIDVNDNSPTFTETVYRFFFNTSDVNTVIGKVSAIDEDVPDTPNSNTTYRIYQASQDPPTAGGLYPLYVDTHIGEIVINGSVQPNTTYSMILEGCDNPVNIGERRCGITRVVAAYTQNTSFTSMAITMEIVENSIIGTLIGQLPIYGDQYDLSSSDFVVDIPSHMLKTAIELDREMVDVYNVTVNVVSDTMGPIGEVNITIHVTDMNDNPPVFDEDGYFFTIPQSQSENTVIGSIKASDLDAGNNSNLVYTFQQNTFSAVFDLDPTNGSITVKDNWWISTPRSFYQLTVVVSDLGMPSLQTSSMIYISEMSSDESTSSIKVGVVADSSIINGNKTSFESGIAELLDITRVNILQVEAVQDSQTLIRSYINLTGYYGNDTAYRVSDLQRLVVDNWTPIQDLFREPVQYMYITDGTSGELKTAEIALIVLAGVILIGGVISIVVICKMWNRHLKSQRLYESLRRPSTIYDDQELRLDFGDEHGVGNTHRDFHRSRSKEPQELEGSFGLGYINTAYTADDDEHSPKTPTWGANDTPRIPRWSTSDSLKDAIESLQELTNRLNAEDSISRITSLSRENKSMRSYKSSIDETPIIDDIQEKHKDLRDTDDYITPIVDYPVDVDTVNDDESNETVETDVTKTNSGIFYVDSFRKQCGDNSDSDDKTVIVEATAF